MAQNKVHHLVVTHKGLPIGTIDDRDIFYRWFHQAKSQRVDLESLSVNSVLRTGLPLITPETPLLKILEWMNDCKTSVLLYKENPTSWRAITETDLLKLMDYWLQPNKPFQALRTETETNLAYPLAQKVIEMLSLMGI